MFSRLQCDAAGTAENADFFIFPTSLVAMQHRQTILDVPHIQFTVSVILRSFFCLQYQAIIPISIFSLSPVFPPFYIGQINFIALVSKSVK